LFCLRGVPCLFYGTEQYLVNNTDGGNDPYNRPMMETWDTGGNCYRLLDTLISVRRQNQALTFGSHQQLYVSDNVYAFIRSYRDCHALCVLNKGPATQVTLDLAGRFAEDQLTCVLTGSTFGIASDCLTLDLSPGSAHLFSQPGHRVEGPVVATFQINGIESQPGDQLFLLGDSPELGQWNLDHAYGMEYVNRNTWICEVAFAASINKRIRFKYALVNHAEGKALRENILPRQLVLPPAGRAKVDSIWQSY